MQGALDSFQFLRADPVLQVMLKIRNALVDGGGALAAFLGRNQTFEPGVFGDNFPRDKAGLLHALQHGGNAGTVGVEPGFQITLVDLLAAFRFLHQKPQHHAAHTGQLRADPGADVRIQRAGNFPRGIV